jgi:hypothetical protein
MAAFQIVIKQFHRMCIEHPGCDGCPLIDVDKRCSNVSFDCFSVADERAEEFEYCITKWAIEHPEPKYPTWIQWWDENFKGNGRKMLTPCSFMPPSDLGCSIEREGCMNAPHKCWNTPIPADIAKKLGIKPMEVE